MAQHLQSLHVSELEMPEIRQLIRSVPTYRNLADSDIVYEHVCFDRFIPIQTVLTSYKLARARSAIAVYSRFGLDLFSAIRVLRQLPADTGTEASSTIEHSSLWLPPIIEIHKGKYVMLDGHHRLFALFSEEAILHQPVKVITLRDVNEPLPAHPLGNMANWIRHVELDPARYALGRSQRYLDFKGAYWRDFSAIRQYHDLG